MSDRQYWFLIFTIVSCAAVVTRNTISWIDSIILMSFLFFSLLKLIPSRDKMEDKKSQSVVSATELYEDRQNTLDRMLADLKRKNETSTKKRSQCPICLKKYTLRCQRPDCCDGRGLL